MNNYDTILYLDKPILEYDERTFATKRIDPYDKAIETGRLNYDDPKLYDRFSFGKRLQRDLSTMGEGAFAKVTDFGKWVVVEAGFTDTITGRSDSKTFLIVFQLKGDGLVMNTANKYRSISGVDQAISYIRSACSSLKSDTNKKL